MRRTTFKTPGSLIRMKLKLNTQGMFAYFKEKNEIAAKYLDNEIERINAEKEKYGPRSETIEKLKSLSQEEETKKEAEENYQAFLENAECNMGGGFDSILRNELQMWNPDRKMKVSIYMDDANTCPTPAPTLPSGGKIATSAIEDCYEILSLNTGNHKKSIERDPMILEDVQQRIRNAIKYYLEVMYPADQTYDW